MATSTCNGPTRRASSCFQVPADPCLGTGATAITRIVAGAAGRLQLALPWEGTVDASLGGANLDLDSGQGIALPQSSRATGQSIYYMSISAAKSMGASKGLLIEATKASGTARITITTAPAPLTEQD